MILPTSSVILFGPLSSDLNQPHQGLHRVLVLPPRLNEQPCSFSFSPLFLLIIPVSGLTFLPLQFSIRVKCVFCDIPPWFIWYHRPQCARITDIVLHAAASFYVETDWSIVYWGTLCLVVRLVVVSVGYWEILLWNRPSGPSILSHNQLQHKVELMDLYGQWDMRLEFRLDRLRKFFVVF